MSAHLFVAAIYDALMVPADKLGFERVRKMVAEKAFGRVLEIGAGTGLNFRFFENAACVLAIEPDNFMLRRAVSRLSEVASRDGKKCAVLVRAAAETIPFPDNSFDTVISTLTFCTIGNPLKAAEEIRRVMKPEGRFYFAEHPIADRPFLAKAEKLVTPLWKKTAGGCHLDRDIVSYFRSGGLDIVGISRLDDFFVAGEAAKGKF